MRLANGGATTGVHRLLALLVCGLVATTPRAAAAEEPHGARVFPVDLGPRRPSFSIATRKFATTDAGDYFQLVVSDRRGREVWSGPRKPDDTDALIFGAWHHGVSLPECVGDIDADGQVELVAPAPQSDVSPVLFRVLRWDGSACHPVRSGTLVEDPPGSGRFPWSRSDRSVGRWVSHFREVTGGAVSVDIVEYRGGDSAQTGRALLTPHASGYRVLRWLQRLE